MSTNSKSEKIKEQFDSIFNNKTTEEELKLDSYLLMASFLSEIELVLENRGIAKSSLAKQIGTSGSYLTQVFNGDKPLNFATLAKIQKALDILFVTRVYCKERSNYNKNIVGITKRTSRSKRFAGKAL